MKQGFKKLFALLLTLSICCSVPSIAHAENSIPETGTGIPQNDITIPEQPEQDSTIVRPDNISLEDLLMPEQNTTTDLSSESQAVSGSAVLLIQTNKPWNSDANTRILDGLKADGHIGYYDVANSFNSAVKMELEKYSLVIVANDQTTQAYSQYPNLKEKLEKYIYDGGAVLFGTCDQGWGGNGTFGDSIPGNIIKYNNNDPYNYIVDDDHPIITGELTDGQPLTDSMLSGNYCSHTYFKVDSLPEGSNVILRSKNTDGATLVEYPYGNGLVIGSGITWEHAYVHHPTTFGKFYDDVIIYALNSDVNTGIYSDKSCTKLATIPERTLYANGGAVKQADKKKINFKSKTYYVKLKASDIKFTNKKGKVKTKKGKLVAGITASKELPKLVKNKIKDPSVSKIAKVSINKKGKLKVTAKQQSGTVYLWVMDTGDEHAYVYAKLRVKSAASSIQIFDKSSRAEGFSADKKNVYKKGNVELGQTIKLYIYPTYKLNKVKKETKDASYNISINDKAKKYFEVAQDTADPNCFIVKALGLKDNKKVKGKVTIKCNQNGKKSVFLVTAVNSIQKISLGSVNGMSAVTTEANLPDFAFTITGSAIEKKEGSFELVTSSSDDTFKTTDKLKIYAMGSENGFDKAKMSKGKVKITSKATGKQKMITAKLNSDKKTITVKAAKKVPNGTTAYYLVVYNTQENKGYKVVKITAAGEAQD